MASPESLRRHNLSLLLRSLHQSGAVSRSEIGATLGMTRTTISELVADLRGRGLLQEGDPARLGGPGRPSLMARPNPEGAAAITAEIAVNSLSAAVVGLGGCILHLERATHTSRRLAVEQTIEDIGKLIQSAQASIPAHCWVSGLGVAVPGVVRRADGLVHFAPNLGWRDVPLGQLIADRLGASLPILIANEADLGALAEHTWGAGAGVNHLIYLSSEYGVGGGIITDGKPLVGAAGCAGEVGHVQVNPLGVRCRCGAIGCWETEIGGPALLRRAGRTEKSYRPEAVSRLLKEASWGDPVALLAVEEVGRWLGAGLAGLINTFNPERVVLSGFLGSMWPLVERIVHAELRVRAMAPALEVVEIKSAQLGVDAPLLGAAELALTRVLDDPTLVGRGLDRDPGTGSSEMETAGAARSLDEVPSMAPLGRKLSS
jgi:predicted NBD/HSP70 family sugar kinase